VNSDIGVEAGKKFDPATWKLQVIKKRRRSFADNIKGVDDPPKNRDHL